MKTKIVSLLGALLVLCGSTTAQVNFDKTKDLFLAQFDSKPDPDDIHSIAAVGSMLAHPDLHNVDFYAVQGTVGRQGGQFIPAPALMTMAFGQQNVRWTQAGNGQTNTTPGTANWNASVDRVRVKAKAALDRGGKIYIMEAGNSDFSHDWIQELVNQTSYTTTDTQQRIIVVQHQIAFNEAQTTPAKLAWVKANTDYRNIGDGNGAGNGTPDYQQNVPNGSFNDTFSSAAEATGNPNTHARDMWREAESAIVAVLPRTPTNQIPTYSSIRGRGVDFSDAVEAWYIFNLGTTVDNIQKFWNRYVTNTNSANAPVPGPLTVGGVQHTETPARDADLTTGGGSGGVTAVNTSVLEISPNDTAYLKFNLTNITLTNANLVLKVTSSGSGTIRVHEFDGTNGGWLENTLAQNIPGQGAQLGSVTGTFTVGQNIQIPISAPGINWTNLIVSMDAGGSSVSVSAIEGADDPRITYGNGGSATVFSYRDAYLAESGGGGGLSTTNTANLTVAPATDTYMKFDVSEVTSPTTTKLVLTTTGSGNGTLRVYQGVGGGSWLESTLANAGVAPTLGTELGSVNGSFTAGGTVEIDLGTWSPPAQWFTLIVSMDSGGTAATFSSKEGANAPRLEFGGQSSPPPTLAETKDPARDAYTVNSGTTPAVDSTELKFSPTDTSYLKFTPVGSGINVSGAKLSFNVTSGGNGTIRVHQGVG
ncbi:MAG: hypothetical protein AAF571_13290, partial [Verrucomicrobiota bacterium]